ncbi:MAG: response regulator transcription factor [Pseudomonadota bacterium]
MLLGHSETTTSVAALPQIKIALVVGSRLYGEMISNSLRASARLTIEQVFSSTQDASNRLDTAPCDVVLLDPMMPGALEFAQQLAQQPVHIVCLTAPEERDAIIAFTQAGVDGFAPRDCASDDLTDVIVAANERRFPCDSEVRVALARHVAARKQKKSDAPQNLPSLTKREQEILACIADGRSNKVIAADLFISVSTVKHHVHNLLEKLGATNRTEAVNVARRLSIV